MPHAMLYSPGLHSYTTNAIAGPDSQEKPTLKKADNVYKKTAIIFNFKIFWPKYAKIRHFS